MTKTITPDGRIIPPGTPTQVAHPGRTTFRSVLQVTLAVMVGIVVFGPPIIDAVLVEASLPEGLRAALVAVSAVVVAIAGIATRIMAIPGVNEILQRIGLGTGVTTERPLAVDQTPPPADWTPQHRSDLPYTDDN